MQVKKKCKGINKAKLYEGCLEVTYIYRFGLCKSCFMDWCFNSEEGRLYYASQFKPSAKKNLNTIKNKENLKYKEDNKSIAALINDAKVYFQRYVRMRDANLPCISCGSDTEMVDGGHYKKAELYRGVIFDEMNVNSQCRKCNKFLNGNEANYRTGLVERFSETDVLNLEQRANETRAYPWSRSELLAIKDKYREKCKAIYK